MTTLFISHSAKDRDWALEIREALRDQGYQLLFLDSHPDDGIPVGANWEKELYQKLRQSWGLVVLCTANWLASPWCVAEVMITRERGRKIFMLATAEVIDERQNKAPGASEPMLRIPDFLKDTQFIPLAGVTPEEAYERLWRGLNEQLRPQDRFPSPKRPYPGLEPFDETDAGIFFGRDHEIQRVESALTRRRRDNAEGFILVLGASGCGKSSLVRAGVMPRLGRIGGDADRRWLIPRPILAGRGFGGLTSALREAFENTGRAAERNVLRQRLECARHEGGIKSAARELREIADELLDVGDLAEAHVVLVLDQLEEVFGTAPGSSARILLQLLLEASVADIENRLVVLATMRSDFLNAFQSFPGAAYRYKEIPLDPMPASHFGEIIEGPAERFGLRLAPGLTERLVEDTRHDDALPLLAFTLAELHARGAADGIFTHQKYDKLFPPVVVSVSGGATTTYRGVTASIKQTADEILRDTGYEGLPEDDPSMRDLRRAFFNLAQVGEEGQFTRRVALQRKMPDSCRAVLERFQSHRLLVSGIEDREPTLTVAHEALFRVWDTLDGWLRQCRKALALRAQIEDAAAEWQAEDRAESRAWPEQRIIDAIAEINRSGVFLDDLRRPALVREFVGPTDQQELQRLPALSENEDGTACSGRYGELWRLPLGHAARASLGVRLALLVDRRPGVGVRADGLPDIAWHEIDGSQVSIEIRDDPNDTNSEVVGTRTAAVARFAIARHLITVSQFRVFLQDCHRDGRWHLPSDSLVDLAIDSPPPKHRARHGNHPADGVNWYDAMAFCHWLSVRLEREVRLPTEFEWQLAATGGDPANIYPWGTDWAPLRANTIESGLGRTTAVGMYPLGASKSGVLDMAGTIYEWCLNNYERPELFESSTHDSDARVVRGGSWSSSPARARCACRLRSFPFDRYSYFGFRVVTSSPLLHADG